MFSPPGCRRRQPAEQSGQPLANGSLAKARGCGSAWHGPTAGPELALAVPPCALLSTIRRAAESKHGCAASPSQARGRIVFGLPLKRPSSADCALAEGGLPALRAAVGACLWPAPRRGDIQPFWLPTAVQPSRWADKGVASLAAADYLAPVWQPMPGRLSEACTAQREAGPPAALGIARIRVPLQPLADISPPTGGRLAADAKASQGPTPDLAEAGRQ